MSAAEEVLEGEVISSNSMTMVEQLTRGEIDMQIATAKRYPRDLKSCIRKATEYVTLTEDMAAGCIYALKRDEKTIEGPSARFAESLFSSWGNARTEARVVEEGEKFVTARAVFFDLENNSAIAFEVKRRITNKYGKRYGDDMIGVTGAAAASIAMRNAVLKGIPRAIWWPIYESARKCAIGDAHSLSSRRQTMVEYFGKMGVTSDQICETLSVDSVQSITLDQLAVLKGFATRIKDGESIEQIFHDETAAQPSTKGSKAKLSPLNQKAKEDKDGELFDNSKSTDAVQEGM